MHGEQAQPRARSLNHLTTFQNIKDHLMIFAHPEVKNNSKCLISRGSLYSVEWATGMDYWNAFRL